MLLIISNLYPNPFSIMTPDNLQSEKYQYCENTFTNTSLSTQGSSVNDTFLEMKTTGCSNVGNSSVNFLEDAQVLQIYWPSDIISILKKSKFSPGVAIGWRNSDNDLVVVTVLPYVHLSIINDMLKKDLFLKKYKISPKQLYSVCGSNTLSILGTINCSSLDYHSDEYLHFESPFTPHQSFFNLKYLKGMKYPEIAHDSINSISVHPFFLSVDPLVYYFPYSFTQIIIFDPPLSSRLQYFSLTPPSLELPENTSFTVISEQLEKTLVERELEIQELCEKIKDHTESYSKELLDSRNQSERVLKNCIAQLNTCNDLSEAIQKMASELYPLVLLKFPSAQQQSLLPSQNLALSITGPKIKRRFSVSELAVESAKQVKGRLSYRISKVFKRYVAPVFAYFFIYTLMFLRIVAEGILLALEWRPLPSWNALKDTSATAQQIDLRLQQFCYSPFQYLLIRRRSQDWTRNFASFNVEYVLFYNTIWLIVNDIIIGFTLAQLIFEFRDQILKASTYLVEELLTTELEKTIIWLMDWPGGLKLNNELAAFFGGLFIWVIQLWGTIHQLFVVPYFQFVILLVAYSGFGGATLLLSVVSDLVSLGTLHVYAFYLSSGRIYHWQLTVLRSLFHLFRGKKRNILRNRVDSCSYQLDQLMMGTIFFTALVFLLPTVLVFYLTFAAGRLAIIIVNAGLESCLACLNHFPLFAIMLYLKDYKRLPGGISFVLTDNNTKLPESTSSQPTTTSHVLLKPLPLPISTMFFQYRLLYSRIKFLYLSTPIILRLVSGQFVPIQRSQLYSLLYSQLPRKREPVRKTWTEMEHEFLKKQKT